MDINLKQPRGSGRTSAGVHGASVTSMPLDALRGSRQLTQVQMANLLKISQGAVSKVERRTDMFVSTLRNYVRAIGGDLQIRAVFPDGDILIDQFNNEAMSSEKDSAKANGDAQHEIEETVALS